jgi:RNA polymerase sigma-70 factor (ECF subfamily)
LEDEHAPIFHGHGLIVLTMSGDRISAITGFVDSALLARFGLPGTLPA